jgi:hypothetical protein
MGARERDDEHHFFASVVTTLKLRLVATTPSAFSTPHGSTLPA